MAVLPDDCKHSKRLVCTIIILHFLGFLAAPTKTTFIPPPKLSPCDIIINSSVHDIDVSSVLAASKPLKSSHSTSVNLSLLRSKSKSSRHALFLISLLVRSGSVEVNPGPTFKNPCRDCSRPCRKDQPAILCENCNFWFHRKCLQMNPDVYEALANSSVSWICCHCGLPNFSSSLFDSHSKLNISNSFSPLQDLNDQDHTPVSSIDPLPLLDLPEFPPLRKFLHLHLHR